MSVTLFTWINERYRKATLPKTYDIIFDSKCIYIINERYVLDVFDRLHPNKSFKTVLIPENHCLCCLLVSENTQTFSFHFQAPAANILII